MASSDTSFGGSIPAIYDRHLAPYLFVPYADEVARRAAALAPSRILETAAGTGLATAALARTCPSAEIVATDLNQAMLDVAAQRVLSDKVSFVAADGQSLPFEDSEFDLVVCQFGVMFYPDKIKGNAEARRVLRNGGRYMVVIWDRLENNPASLAIHQAMLAAFPDDPPGFLARTPWGYGDPAGIEHDLLAAGFTDIEFETVPLRSEPSATAEDAAVGLTQGSPLRAEIEQRGEGALKRATQAARETLEAMGSEFDGRLSAHIVTAVR
ncbi:MAG TPA: methyltransferase domain-containing protein [Sphingomicrobium sp.]|nr:methyltransferase domain-containing protein [Sphingomicrobium sp.]